VPFFVTKSSYRSAPIGAEWDEDESIENIYLPIEMSFIQFRVVFDDVVLSISTGHGNIPSAKRSIRKCLILV